MAAVPELTVNVEYHGTLAALIEQGEQQAKKIAELEQKLDQQMNCMTAIMLILSKRLGITDWIAAIKG